MSEKAKSDLVQLNFRVPKDIRKGLNLVADAEDVNAQELGAEIIRFYLGVAEPEAEERRTRAAHLVKTIGVFQVQRPTIKPNGTTPPNPGGISSTSKYLLVNIVGAEKPSAMLSPGATSEKWNGPPSPLIEGITESTTARLAA